MPILDVDLDVDLSILESLDEVIPCSADNDNCKNEATHLLGCGICDQKETACQLHIAYIILMKKVIPKSPIVFNATCGHVCPVIECSVNPLIV